MGGSANQSWNDAMSLMANTMMGNQAGIAQAGQDFNSLNAPQPQPMQMPPMQPGGGAQFNPMLAAQGGTNAMQQMPLQQILAVLGGGPYGRA